MKLLLYVASRQRLRVCAEKGDQHAITQVSARLEHGDWSVRKAAQFPEVSNGRFGRFPTYAKVKNGPF